MSKFEKAGHAPGFRFIRVYWKRFVTESAGMRHVISASSDGPLGRNVNHIEHEWSMYWNRRMQAARRLPCTVSHTADKIAVSSRWLKGQTPSIARDDHSFVDQALYANLHPLHG